MSLPILLVEPDDASPPGTPAVMAGEGAAELEAPGADETRMQRRASMPTALSTSNAEEAQDDPVHPASSAAEPDAGVDLLNDADLFRLEVALGEEYFRRELLQPRLRDTTFLVPEGSAGLLRAWTRWHEASIALTRRGLPTWRRNEGMP